MKSPLTPNRANKERCFCLASKIYYLVNKTKITLLSEIKKLFCCKITDLTKTEKKWFFCLLKARIQYIVESPFSAFFRYSKSRQKTSISCRAKTSSSTFFEPTKLAKPQKFRMKKKWEKERPKKMGRIKRILSVDWNRMKAQTKETGFKLILWTQMLTF